MNILISNDDGFKARGINILFDELTKNHATTMIAPDVERSSCGHGITLGEPLRLTDIDKDKYSCTGYPADCILVGIGSLLKDNRPDLVVSGINHGANLGQDRYYSGTIAAAREAAFRNIPAIAMSLVTYNSRGIEHFETASEFLTQLLETDIQQLIPEFCVLNINVPNLPLNKIAGVKYATPGIQNYTEEVVERKDSRNKPYYWVGGTYQGYEDIPGSDCVEVNKGFITLNIQDLAGKESQSNDIKKIKAIINNL
jgi:5'-nucleotidase